MSNKHSLVIEEYIRVIYLLENSNEPVKAVTITSHVQSTPSTVHATLSRMQRDDLVKVDSKKKISLTKKGKEFAKYLMNRHYLAECFLCNTLEIPWHEVHKHAHKLEHALTPLVVEKLAEYLEHPKYCPHGSPVDGYKESSFKDASFLEQVTEGSTVKILMIDESLESSEELLKHLHSKSIIPGQKHIIKEKLTAVHILTLESEKGELATLPFDIAQKILVKVLF